MQIETMHLLMVTTNGVNVQKNYSKKNLGSRRKSILFLMVREPMF